MIVQHLLLFKKGKHDENKQKCSRNKIRNDEDSCQLKRRNKLV